MTNRKAKPVVSHTGEANSKYNRQKWLYCIESKWCSAVIIMKADFTYTGLNHNPLHWNEWHDQYWSRVSMNDDHIHMVWNGGLTLCAEVYHLNFTAIYWKKERCISSQRVPRVCPVTNNQHTRLQAELCLQSQWGCMRM